jgi:16S rRNA (uracil1498-N3)-methyltransferase
MHRFYLPPDQTQSAPLFLTGAEAHHGTRVLRLRRKDKITVLNGAGGEFLCEVEASDRDKIKLSVLEHRQSPPRPCQITLLMGIPKGKIIESIIQKATELGAARIIPLLTERVVTKLDAKEAARKAAKWQQIAIEAIKQCGSPWLPTIEPAFTPQAFLDRQESFDLPLVASLQPGSKHAHEFFHNFRSHHKRQPASVSIWIGPEGDLTEAEITAITSSGAHPITLGSLVLRVETAAIYCLAVINHELSANP